MLHCKNRTGLESLFPLFYLYVLLLLFFEKERVIKDSTPHRAGPKPHRAAIKLHRHNGKLHRANRAAALVPAAFQPDRCRGGAEKTAPSVPSYRNQGLFGQFLPIFRASEKGPVQFQGGSRCGFRSLPPKAELRRLKLRRHQPTEN